MGADQKQCHVHFAANTKSSRYSACIETLFLFQTTQKHMIFIHWTTCTYCNKALGVKDSQLEVQPLLARYEQTQILTFVFFTPTCTCINLWRAKKYSCSFYVK